MMASYPKDLTGLRFGRLVVLGKNPERYVSPKGKTESKWDCLCDCGNRVTITRSHLIKGISRSCGCYMRDKARSQAQDLTGMRFGHLTVSRKGDARQTNRYRDYYRLALSMRLRERKDFYNKTLKGRGRHQLRLCYKRDDPQNARKSGAN